MKVASSLPTAFAKNVAMGVDLLPNEQTRKNHDDYEHRIQTLGAFQQLAIAGDFDSAMLAYSFMKDSVTEEQTTALQVIHNTTKQWLLGHISGELLDQLANKLLSGRDKRDIAQTLLECMEGQHGNGAMTPDRMEGLLVRLTNA